MRYYTRKDSVTRRTAVRPTRVGDRRTAVRPTRVGDRNGVLVRRPLVKHDSDFDLGNRSRLGHGNDDLSVAITKATKALHDLDKTENPNTAEVLRRAIVLLKKAKHMVGDDEGFESEFGDSRAVKHL